MDDLASIERLQEENLKILESNTKSQQSRNTLKNDYEKLREKLSTLADRTTHPVMIPVGSVGYLPGTLVHTNEIMVLLGDNWFAERSTKQAIDIVNRRIEMIDKQLSDLSKEYSNIQSHLEYGKQFQDINKEHGGIKEIKEDLPADDIPESSKDKRRIAHKPKHNLTERKIDFSNKPKSSSANQNCSENELINHDELLARLNQLEKEEQEESLREHEKQMQLLMEGASNTFDSQRNGDVSHEEFIGATSMDHEHPKRHVKFESDTFDDVNTNLIRFSHSGGEQRPRSSSEPDLLFKPNSSDNIVSPADIYERFTQKHEDDNTRPLKSILKKDSRSNSTENLKLRPILKTSPDHRPDTPENVLDDPKPILKTPPDTQGSDRRPGTPDYISLDDPKPILKLANEHYSNFDVTNDDPRPILKTHEVHFDDENLSEDIPPFVDLSVEDTIPILKTHSNDGQTKRPPTPDDDRKSILKTSNKINVSTNSRPKEIVMGDYKPILKHNSNIAVSENVIERSQVISSVHENDRHVEQNKPVSRFKASRLKK